MKFFPLSRLMREFERFNLDRHFYLRVVAASGLTYEIFYQEVGWFYRRMEEELTRFEPEEVIDLFHRLGIKEGEMYCELYDFFVSKTIFHYLGYKSAEKFLGEQEFKSKLNAWMSFEREFKQATKRIISGKDRNFILITTGENDEESKDN